MGFSFARFVRLLTASLEGVIVVGLLLRLSYRLGWPLIDWRIHWVAMFMLMFSWLGFVFLQVCLLFPARRRALFALARGGAYLIVCFLTTIGVAVA